MFSWAFCDFGAEFEVLDATGEESKKCFVGSITKVGSKAQHQTAWHGTARHCMARHSTARHSTALHGTAQQQITAQHNTVAVQYSTVAVQYSTVAVAVE